MRGRSPVGALALLGVLEHAYADRDQGLRVAAVLEGLREIVPFASAMWLTVVASLEFGDSFQLGCTAQDVALYVTDFATLDPLLAAASRVGGLNVAVRLSDLPREPEGIRGGFGEFARRFRHRHAMGVLSACCGQPVAFARLHRDEGDPDFTPAEAEIVRCVLAHLARGAGIAEITGGQAGEGTPGVVVFGPGGEVLFRSGIAGQPLSESEIRNILRVATPVGEGFVTIGKRAYRAKALPLADSGILACFAPDGSAGRVGAANGLLPGRHNTQVFLSPVRTRRNLRERMRRLHFTDREIEVGLQVLQGRSNEEIAAALNIHLQTVKEHLGAIYRKSGRETRMKFMAGLLGLDGEPLASTGAASAVDSQAGASGGAGQLTYPDR